MFEQCTECKRPIVMGNSVTSEFKDFVHQNRIVVACRNGIQFYMTSELKSTENPILLKLALNNKSMYIERESVK